MLAVAPQIVQSTEELLVVYLVVDSPLSFPCNPTPKILVIGFKKRQFYYKTIQISSLIYHVKHFNRKQVNQVNLLADLRCELLKFT